MAESKAVDVSEIALSGGSSEGDEGRQDVAFITKKLSREKLKDEEFLIVHGDWMPVDHFLHGDPPNLDEYFQDDLEEWRRVKMRLMITRKIGAYAARTRVPLPTNPADLRVVEYCRKLPSIEGLEKIYNLQDYFVEKPSEDSAKPTKPVAVPTLEAHNDNALQVLAELAVSVFSRVLFVCFASFQSSLQEGIRIRRALMSQRAAKWKESVNREWIAKGFDVPPYLDDLPDRLKGSEFFRILPPNPSVAIVPP